MAKRPSLEVGDSVGSTPTSGTRFGVIMKPKDELFDVMVKSLAYDSHGRYAKPGSIILGMSEEKREILKQLRPEKS